MTDIATPNETIANVTTVIEKWIETARETVREIS